MDRTALMGLYRTLRSRCSFCSRGLVKDHVKDFLGNAWFGLILDFLNIIEKRIIRIGQIQKTVFFLPDIDKSPVYRRQDGLDLAFVDIAKHGLMAVKLNIKIIQLAVYQDRYSPLVLGDLNKDFFRHSFLSFNVFRKIMHSHAG